MTARTCSASALCTHMFSPLHAHVQPLPFAPHTYTRPAGITNSVHTHADQAHRRRRHPPPSPRHAGSRIEVRAQAHGGGGGDGQRVGHRQGGGQGCGGKGGGTTQNLVRSGGATSVRQGIQQQGKGGAVGASWNDWETGIPSTPIRGTFRCVVRGARRSERLLRAGLRARAHAVGSSDCSAQFGVEGGTEGRKEGQRRSATAWGQGDSPARHEGTDEACDGERHSSNDCPHRTPRPHASRTPPPRPRPRQASSAADTRTQPSKWVCLQRRHLREREGAGGKGCPAAGFLHASA